jgi:hypothetical protein
MRGKHILERFLIPGFICQTGFEAEMPKNKHKHKHKAITHTQEHTLKNTQGNLQTITRTYGVHQVPKDA